MLHVLHHLFVKPSQTVILITVSAAAIATTPQELQAANPGVIALPGFGEISSFVNSLIQRAKKGHTGMPRGPPPKISDALAAELQAVPQLQWVPLLFLLPASVHFLHSQLDIQYHGVPDDAGGYPNKYRIPATNKIFKKEDLYLALKAMHADEIDFPSLSRVNTLITAQRKLRAGPANLPLPAPDLLRK